MPDDPIDGRRGSTATRRMNLTILDQKALQAMAPDETSRPGNQNADHLVFSPES
jgi:hypothetical protein